jgi:hypothetical protein
LDQSVREEADRIGAVGKSPVVRQPAESVQEGVKSEIRQTVACASISVTSAEQKHETFERGRRCCQWHDDPVGVVSEEDDEDEDYLTWIELSDDD